MKRGIENSVKKMKKNCEKYNEMKHIYIRGKQVEIRMQCKNLERI
jgi:hypothetical protein